MKTLITLFLSLSVFLVLTSCSSDNESFQTINENPDPQDYIKPQKDVFIPMESLADIGAVSITGYPKMIKKYENDTISYWAQYYFRPDGNILKLNYGYPRSKSGTSSYNYQYDTEGKLVKLDGHEVSRFFWDDGLIIKAEAYNGAWYGRYDFFYDYDDQGQLIQKLVVYYGATPITTLKSNYTYLDDGNLKSIEFYVDSNGSDTFELNSITNFSDYNEPRNLVLDRNLFLELEIIPEQSEIFQFPVVKEYKNLSSSGYDVYETYRYKYNTNGRVVEKLYGNNKIVYEYY